MPLLRRRVHPERLIPHAAPLRALPDVPRPAHKPPGRPRVVWRFSDGKAGHDSQSLGLVDALKRQARIECYDIPVLPGAGLDWMLDAFRPDRCYPTPGWRLGPDIRHTCRCCLHGVPVVARPQC